MGMEIVLEGWEDGQPYRAVLASVDRWRVQNSHQVTVSVSDTTVKITQEPHLLAATKLGVGTCLWDSSFVLTAFLAAQDPLKWCGARVIELGAGLGLPGIFLALQGAKVMLTDKESLLPLLHHNVLHNSSAAPSQRLNVSIEELDWDSDNSRHKLEELAGTQADYIIASDCLYIDEGGTTPGIQSFIAACSTLCAAPHSCCIVAMEKRASIVTEGFFSTAQRAGFSVVEVAPVGAMIGFSADHIMLLQMHKK